MLERVIWICLAVFLLLFGIFSVTNLQVEWGRPLMGFAALVAGIACAVKVLQGDTKTA